MTKIINENIYNNVPITWQTFSEMNWYGFSKQWLLEVSHIFSPNDQPLEN